MEGCPTHTRERVPFGKSIEGVLCRMPSENGLTTRASMPYPKQTWKTRQKHPQLKRENPAITSQKKAFLRLCERSCLA